MSKILLVDDEELNRDFLLRRLEKRGFTVTTAVNGSDACEKTAAQLPDLILMDVNMPVMDGLQATRQLKSQPETQNNIRRVILDSVRVGRATWLPPNSNGSTSATNGRSGRNESFEVVDVPRGRRRVPRVRGTGRGTSRRGHRCRVVF